MATVRVARRRLRLILAALGAGVLVLAAPAAAGAAPHEPGAGSGAPILGQVARPQVKPPAPLPVRTGSVPVTGTRAKAAAGLNDRVALRALVIATDAADWGVPTLTTTLNRVGAAYDVLYSADTALTSATLVRSDGVGKYNAILLTSSMLVYSSNGSFLSGLDGTEWNTLWNYERNFGVRQAALSTSYGTYPEDYCLRSVSEGAVGDTPLNVSLTSAGAAVFDYLQAAATIPVVQSYVYRTSIAPGCSATATMTAGTDVLGVRTTSTDNRERLAVTFSNNVNLLQSDLVVYGLVRWATKGMFLGEQRHYLNVDVDDWFNNADHRFPDGHIETDPGFQVSAHDAYALKTRQDALRTAQPQAAAFTLNLAYNGADIQPGSTTACSPDGGIDQLTSTSRCLKDDFRWINHTLSHPELNVTDYATTYAEIADNFSAAAGIGLTVPGDVLKTPEYSGLGVYSNDPDDDTSPPIDHGLGASNTNLLTAAQDLGVKYLHGNFSFPSHVPANFNANIVHPLNSAVSVVPDWPTNIAYHVTTPEEETSWYNSIYGPSGSLPTFPTDRTYAQIVDYEANVALQHVAAGSIATHTFHIANVRDYGNGRSLVMDWAESVAGKYASYYSTPLLNVNWSALGAYTTLRNAHFAQRAAGVDPVYDRSTGTVTVTSPAAGTVQLSGINTADSTTYGSDRSGPVTLAANTPVTVTAAPRL
ncbi:hypothetical protein [Symbioplanes lichenis]|uniref:Agd3-related carbohydrate-binding protein n=1 Tax=Symbioplanes lichenis TaxID=1629072 RepID=UPI00273875AD|nr:hypothetical protein [Actinoplanes lichenis]